MSGQFAVFGHPIAHSLSPRIHAAFGAQLGIEIDYRAIEAARDGFAARLAAFARDGGAGANVTLPLKQDALALCAELSDRARRAGSVNTLIRVGDRWHGDSTDGIGLLRDLGGRHGFDLRGRRVLLLGAGGAARAAAFALADAGAAELTIANRTPERAIALAAAVGGVAHARLAGTEPHGFDLIVDATAAGHGGGAPELPAGLCAGAFCYELSYGAAARGFLEHARADGATDAVDGLGMLVEQAAESFFLWHGERPHTAPVYAALREAAAAHIAPPPR